jgi:hypothetical protein
VIQKAFWIILSSVLAWGQGQLWSQATAGPASEHHPPAAAAEEDPWDDGEAAAEREADPLPTHPSRAEQISETQLSGLPLNGRSYSQLATLQAGVSDPSAGSASRGGGSGSLTVVGGRSTSNTFLLDGTNIMDAQNQVPRSAAGVQLGSDTVLEVEVLTSQYGPEYGRTSGGVLNSITRSGSSEFHGTFFEYFRNSKLDARNVFDPGTEPTPFKRNQFGATLTGPVWKDRTFFMVSYEGLRDRLTETNANFFPDALARQGILTDCKGSPIQTLEVHPSVKPYLAFYPLPDSDCRGGGIAEKAGPQFQPTGEDFFTVRMDHKVSDRDSLFVRYTFDDATSQSGQDNFLWTQLSESRQQYVTMVLSHIFDPRRLFSVRLGYTRPTQHTDIVEPQEIPRSAFFVAESPHFGQILVPSMTPLGAFPSQPGSNITNTFQGSADVILQNERHSLRFGGEAHRYRWDSDSVFMLAAQWRFNSLASFLQGGPEGTNLQVSLPEGSNAREFRQTMVGMYVQDQFRVTPRLQLNLGLRYEFMSTIAEKNGEVAYLIDPLTDTDVHTGSVYARNPSRANLAPRIGWRWAPFSGGRTVLQGGAGLYYDQIIGYTLVQRKNTTPFWNTITNPNFDASTTFPDALAAAKLPGATPPNVQIMDYFKMKTPQVLRYSFSIQQSLAPQWSVQSSYVGARGIHLLRRYELNLFPHPITRPDGSLCFPANETQVRPQDVRPDCPAVPASAAGPLNPARGTISRLSSDANSFYNSMELALNGRFGQAISLQARYTYSKSVDDASTGPNGGATPQYGYIRTLEQGLSDFDIRHRVSVNYFWTPPFGQGNSGLAAALLSGWRLGGIVSYRTGVPTTIGVNVITQGYLFEPVRPNLVAGQSNNPTIGITEGCSGVDAGRQLGTPDLYYDPCAFSLPAPGTLGNLGRNTVIAPSVFNADVSLQKEFSIDSEKRLQFRAEIFNLLNHPNFSGNQGNTAIVFSGNSGRRNSSAGRLSQSATTARQLQFALRLTF